MMCRQVEPWVLDFGALLHSILRSDVLQNYAICNFDQLYMDDDGVLSIVRKGDVNIVTYNGTVLTLRGVWHARVEIKSHIH